MRQTKTRSLTAFLLTLFLGIGTAVAILPACGDDSGNDSQEQF
ncbi:MAG: hypothetical protein ACE5FL_10590 [Myxococcota bacterium]